MEHPVHLHCPDLDLMLVNRLVWPRFSVMRGTKGFFQKELSPPNQDVSAK